MIKILCLCTVRNRVEKTRLAIYKLNKALENIPLIQYKIVMVDDGSTDNTVDIISHSYPHVTIIQGDGSLFWARGMLKGFDSTWNNDYSHLLVFNDDSDFCIDTLRLIFISLNASEKCISNSIFVGAFIDEFSSKVTYGVQVKKRSFLPFSFKVMPICDQIQFGDTLNMNFAIIPNEIIAKIGFLDPYFTHSMADFDYGLRARKAGFNICQLPSFVGRCSRNSKSNSWEDFNLTFLQKIKSLHSVKYFPPKERLHLLMRHTGMMAPIYFLYPYFKIFCSMLTLRKH
ncbi:glycosyltransferase family 2 protein [Shewanella sp.]|uniref:glycosyltransferase family 2 protein n=1 Tax=Shewanella sp. TaxID=50422 RepID=UPI003D0AB1B0